MLGVVPLNPAATWTSVAGIYLCRETANLRTTQLQQAKVFRGRKNASVCQACRHASMIKPASIVFLLSVGLLCSAQEPASTIKVDVKLVNVFVTVTDAQCV